MQKVEHFAAVNIQLTGLALLSVLLTWGVRLLSSSQQLPLDPAPSLHAEPAEKQKDSATNINAILCLFFLVLKLSKTSDENPAKHYQAHIWTLDSCRPLLPSSGPAAAPPPCSRGRARPASDWLSQGVGVAAASCCGWSSTACSAQWALGASWACTPSTLLRRKRGGGNNTRRGGKKEISVHKHNRVEVVEVRNGVFLRFWAKEKGEKFDLELAGKKNSLTSILGFKPKEKN